MKEPADHSSVEGKEICIMLDRNFLVELRLGDVGQEDMLERLLSEGAAT
jgi:hypothetical protein